MGVLWNLKKVEQYWEQKDTSLLLEQMVLWKNKSTNYFTSYFSSRLHQRFWYIERFVFIVSSTNKGSVTLRWKFWFIIVHQLPICWFDDFIIYAKNLVVPCSLLEFNIADMVFVDCSMKRRSCNLFMSCFAPWFNMNLVPAYQAWFMRWSSKWS